MSAGESLPVFKDQGDAFDLWVIRIEAVLASMNLMDVVDPSPEGASKVNMGKGGSKVNTSKEDFEKEENRKKKAVAVLVNALGDRPLRRLSLGDGLDPAVIWKSLHDRYGPKKTNKEVIETVTKICEMKLKSHMDIDDYIDDYEALFSKLEQIDVIIPECVRVAMLLNSVKGQKELVPLYEGVKGEKQLRWKSVRSQLMMTARLMNKWPAYFI